MCCVLCDVCTSGSTEDIFYTCVRNSVLYLKHVSSKDIPAKITTKPNSCHAQRVNRFGLEYNLFLKHLPGSTFPGEEEKKRLHPTAWWLMITDLHKNKTLHVFCRARYLSDWKPYTRSHMRYWYFTFSPQKINTWKCSKIFVPARRSVSIGLFFSRLLIFISNEW